MYFSELNKNVLNCVFTNCGTTINKTNSKDCLEIQINGGLQSSKGSVEHGMFPHIRMLHPFAVQVGGREKGLHGSAGLKGSPQKFC